MLLVCVNFLSLHAGRRRWRLYVFGSSVRAAVRASVIHVVIFMFPRYLQYLLTDFRQTFVTDASRDRDELIRFWGQKVTVQGHTIAAEAHSTRRYRRVQLFLVYTVSSSGKITFIVIISIFSIILSA